MLVSGVISKDANSSKSGFVAGQPDLDQQTTRYKLPLGMRLYKCRVQIGDAEARIMKRDEKMRVRRDETANRDGFGLVGRN